MTPRVLLVVACALVGLATAAYIAGRESGRHSVKLEQNTAQLAVNAESIATATKRTEDAAKRSAAELAKRDSLVTKRAQARARVTVTDGTVVVDSQPPVIVPPEVIALIGLSDTLIRQDSLTISALRVQVRLLEVERDAWKQRAALMEARVDLVKPSRCGMKCGIAIGATGVLAIVFAAGSLVR